MKKIFALLPLMFLGDLAPAQGLVNFYNHNNATEAVSVMSSGGTVSLTTGANSYNFILFYSTTASTVLGAPGSVTASESQIGSYAFEDSNWTFGADYGLSLATPGVFTNANYNFSRYSTVNNLPAGTPARFVVIGWSANIGSTLGLLESFVNGTSSVVDGYIGESAVSGLITPGNGTSLAVPALFGLSAPALQGFTLGEYDYAVPEPATIALGAMGALSIFALRRKTTVK